MKNASTFNIQIAIQYFFIIPFYYLNYLIDNGIRQKSFSKLPYIYIISTKNETAKFLGLVW